ncbi:MAG: CBS domain-containing protein, partial [Planctomycetota bacterium]
VKPDMRINELDKVFVKDGINGAPVVDENGDLIGVVSKSDIVNYDLKKGTHASSMSDYYSSTGLEPQQMTDDFITDTLTFTDTTVKDIMKPSVITGQPDDSIQDISRTMYEKKIHRLVIVEGSKVAGIVSTLDILKIVGTK